MVAASAAELDRHSGSSTSETDSSLSATRTNASQSCLLPKASTEIFSNGRAAISDHDDAINLELQDFHITDSVRRLFGAGLPLEDFETKYPRHLRKPFPARKRRWVDDSPLLPPQNRPPLSAEFLEADDDGEDDIGADRNQYKPLRYDQHRVVQSQLSLLLEPTALDREQHSSVGPSVDDGVDIVAAQRRPGQLCRPRRNVLYDEESDEEPETAGVSLVRVTSPPLPLPRTLPWLGSTGQIHGPCGGSINNENAAWSPKIAQAQQRSPDWPTQRKRRTYGKR